jgi:hypothetical protein
MRPAAILLTLVCIALACGLWLFRSRASVAPTPVAPDVAPATTPGANAPDELAPSDRSPAPIQSPVAPTPATKPAPASTDPTNAELTKEEVQALEVETPPGVIEGIVLRGRDPITTGGLVHYRRGPLHDLAKHPHELVVEEGTRQTNIDAHGMFRIAALEPGAYSLAVDVGRGLEQEVWTGLAANKPTRRVVIVLGTTSVKGHVWDDNGSPVSGALVAVEMEFDRKGVRSFRSTRATTNDGSYSMEDLPAGTGWFTVRLPAKWVLNESALMRRITLLPGEQRILDFGAPEPAKQWTGTLRNVSGDIIRGGGRLHLTRKDTQAYAESKIQEDGTFSVLVRPGEYAIGVSLNSDWDHRFELPPLQIGAVDIEHDLTFPGVRVTGVVIDESTGLPVAPKYRIGIGLRPRNANMGGPGTKVDAEGRFVVDGVEPGEWLVSSWPLKLVEGDHELIVSKQDVEIPLRLTVKTAK